MKTLASKSLGLPAGVLCAAFLAPIGVQAQERHKLSFDTPPESSKYTQQHSIDVSDVPGHKVRLFEIQRTYGKNGPMVEGAALKESWTQGMSDYTDLNGGAVVYVTFVSVDGDKIYSRGSLTGFAVSDPGSKAKLRSWVVLNISGGTGRFAGIRGVVRSENISDPATGMNSNKSEMEYWIGK